MSFEGECNVLRPVVDFSENIWKDQFPSLPSSDSVFDSLTKEIIPLKEKVKGMLKASTADPIENVKFIDTLLRLGVSYHFENEIEMQLERIFNSQENLFLKNDYDLNSTSIAFRVSRLHGFKMSCGTRTGDTDSNISVITYPSSHPKLKPHLYFEPSYTRWRIILTKMLVLISILDDTFDAYGTPQELQRFIDALKRWEISALDELQDYTKVICKAVLDVFDEIEDEARKEGRSYTVPYAKNAFIGLINNYQAEVQWCHDGYVPTFEEYMRVAMKTTTYDPMITISFIGMDTIAGLEAFEWLQTEPRIMTAANLIGRILDDIASHKFEQLREHCPSSVECYMKQHNLSEKDTLHDLKKMLEDAWKDINEDCMKPTAIPRDLLLRILNFARVTYLFYKHGDGYTHPDPYMKDDIRVLFVDPVHI